jgi:hypothetical protein
MAPFLTHLVIGERVWTEIDGQGTYCRSYSSFLFGCLAPDVDKFCDGLEQATTHFLAKDPNSTHVWRRSQHFLNHSTAFLRAPFHQLGGSEQAFVLGYLCHVATDEITGRLGLALRSRLAASGASLPNVDAILTAIDPRLWANATDPEHIATALEAATVPDGTFVFAPHDCLEALRQSILPQVWEGGGLEPFLRMWRRQRQWLFHGRVSNETTDPGIENKLSAIRQAMERDMPQAEQLVETVDLAAFMDEAVTHSRQRINALLAAEKES